MNRERWKQIERWWAKALGGQRIPVSGRHDGGSDIDHPVWAIEVKAGAVLSPRLQKALEQANRAGAQTDKRPLVCIEHCRSGRSGSIRVVMMELKDWLDLANGSR